MFVGQFCFLYSDNVCVYFFGEDFEFFYFVFNAVYVNLYDLQVGRGSVRGLCVCSVSVCCGWWSG